MPEVNPVITGAGIKETSLPSLKIPATNKIIPAIKVAIKTPCMP